MYRRYLLALVIGMLLVACSSQQNKETIKPQNEQGSSDAMRVVPDIVYGHKHGMALTFDIYRPKKQNGAGIIWINSAGWLSTWAPFYKQSPTGLRFLTSEELMEYKGITSFDFNKLLAGGFTVFEVRHGSGTIFGIPEIVGDLRRAIRFIRSHTSEYGVEMERLALLGESAGAVMALLLGTSSEVGIPAPTDPYSSSAIEKFEGISGRVAAVISLSGGGIEFPKYSFFAQQPGFAVLPKEIQSYYRRLLDMKDEQRMALSPITYLSSDDPPTLLINGDKDANVPISAAESGYQALLKAGVAAKLVKLAGAGHDSFNNADADRIHKETIDWLVEHLKVK